VNATPAGHLVVAPLLRRALCKHKWATRGWDAETIVHLAAETVGSCGVTVARVLDVVFDAATAFGNVRRLQIVQLLRQRGTCAPHTIVGEAAMSPIACLRHLDKLQRRGYVRHMGAAAWSLCEKARTPFHAALLAEICAHLS